MSTWELTRCIPIAILDVLTFTALAFSMRYWRRERKKLAALDATLAEIRHGNGNGEL